MEGTKPHVFMENKFWEGLTENQPVSYLRILAESSPSGILLFVAPAAREDSLWRELMNRLREASIKTVASDVAAGVAYAAKTSSGPIVALTSWDRLIAMIELEISDEPEALANVHQLRALCKSADSDAFMPFSPEEISNQRIPSIILQVRPIIEKAFKIADSEGIFRVKMGRPSGGWDKIGHYMRFSCASGDASVFGAFFGIDFELWQRHGESPLWVSFFVEGSVDYRRGADVKALLEPEADKRNVFTTMEADRYVIAIKIPSGEEMDVIVKSVVEQLRFISEILSLAPLP